MAGVNEKSLPPLPGGEAHPAGCWGTWRGSPRGSRYWSRPGPASPLSPPPPGPHQLEVKHAVLGFLQKRHELGGEKSQTLLVPAWSTRGRWRLWPGLRHRARPPARLPSARPGQAGGGATSASVHSRRATGAITAASASVSRPPRVSGAIPVCRSERKTSGTVSKCTISKEDESNP